MSSLSAVCFAPPDATTAHGPFSSPPRLAASLRGSEGFTLLEVMVALAILGLALTAILSAQAGLYSANVQARNITYATSAARCKMTEVEEHLLKMGYPETDQFEDGPCCNGESPPGVTCRWQIERVTLPDPPQTDLFGDAGAGGETGGGASPLGPLGALAGAAANPGSLADGGISALSSALSTPVGPNGQAGLQGMAGMALGIVYPQLKPLLEASIRRVTVDAVWTEGVERKVRLVQFVTHPQRGLPPVLDPSMAGAMGDGGVIPPNAVGAPGGFGQPGLGQGLNVPPGLPR